MYHLKGSPPIRTDLCLANERLVRQIIQRSDDGGKTWNTPGSSADELKGPDGMPKGESNNLFTRAKRAGTCGMTAHNIHGSSSASGISSRRYRS